MWTAGFHRTSLSLLLYCGAMVWPGRWLPVAEAAKPEAIPATTSDVGERAELFIALLKRRAQRILEARRAPPPPLVSASAGVSEGYEGNVNLDGARRGDSFTEETLSLIVGPRIASWLRGEFTYNVVNTHFQEFTDSNLWMNVLGSTFQVQPHRAVRLDLGYEYGILNFPFDSDSSFVDHRVKAHVVLAQAAWLWHKMGWTYQSREYDTRKARDADGNALAGVNRHDDRHVGSYELQLRFPKTSARIGGEFYRNFSNERFQDFYDWDDVRVRAVLTRVFHPDWLGTLTASHEHRNYHRRNVPAINRAERDSLITVAGSLIYQLTPHAALTSSLTYRYQDSNDPRLDFTDWLSQIGVTVGF